MKYIINLPWTKPPLSLNDRKHYMAKAKENKTIFNQVLTLATAAALPKHLNHVTVQLHYRPADNRRRDTDNLIASAKPMYDALSVAGTGKQPGYGVVQDDDHIHMSKPEPRIHSHSKGEPPMMWLEITTGDGERR
ncbi:hypothetical protein NG01_04420 [Corynebacterium diphtheriae]|uniref:hypothetical protein n=1 Tax=Corynebacterium diphtheriae TaxID=1717 RepID=UPI0005EB7B52|nr:hypothetical protein [Corynebacterium diphtheriae]KJJ60029.1 hypothetical protein NG01_04420 [Corynebacterium diphtheriae]